MSNKQSKLTVINGSAAGEESTLLTIQLPSVLVDRINAEKANLEMQIRRLREQSDRILTVLLEGYQAGQPEANGRNFELSEDNTKLIEQA